MWRPKNRSQRVRMICLGVITVPPYRHKMSVIGRHPRHPNVHMFACRNSQCDLVIYWDMKQGREVRRGETQTQAF